MANKNENINEDKETDIVCPLGYALNILGGKWKMPIICLLACKEPMRYGVIKKRLGKVTNMMLAQSLKELEVIGMVHREQYNEVPPRVEYSLTEKGKSILPILEQFATWSSENMDATLLYTRDCNICRKTEGIHKS